MRSVVVKETVARQALGKCGLPGFSYSLNPYRGCEHGCVYCYSPCVLREKRPWGTFVDVKVNIPSVVSREIRRMRRGAIWIGSVTDAYQPVERKYELTRRCLEELAPYDPPVSILTKSSLCTRDFDLLQRFSDCELGFSFSCFDESVRKVMEPRTSPVTDRLGAASEAASAGLEPWGFIAPIVPGITTRSGEIERLIEAMEKAGIRRVGFDELRPRSCMWPRFSAFLGKYFPNLLPQMNRMVRERRYVEEAARRIEKVCNELGLQLVV